MTKAAVAKKDSPKRAATEHDVIEANADLNAAVILAEQAQEPVWCRLEVCAFQATVNRYRMIGRPCLSRDEGPG